VLSSALASIHHGCTAERVIPETRRLRGSQASLACHHLTSSRSRFTLPVREWKDESEKCFYEILKRHAEYPKLAIVYFKLHKNAQKPPTSHQPYQRNRPARLKLRHSGPRRPPGHQTLNRNHHSATSGSSCSCSLTLKTNVSASHLNHLVRRFPTDRRSSLELTTGSG
jgi:hypothetical protein